MRLLRHLATTRWSTRRHFPPAVRDAIEQAIGDCEAHHGGEIRFVVETAFDVPELWRGLSPRQRALAAVRPVRGVGHGRTTTAC